MSGEVCCGMCRSTKSPVWMTSSLVLPSSKRRIHDRLCELNQQQLLPCIICTVCYKLLNHWDEQVAAAARTEELIKLRLSRTNIDHMMDDVSGTTLVMLSQPSEHQSPGCVSVISVARSAMVAPSAEDCSAPKPEVTGSGLTELGAAETCSTEAGMSDARAEVVRYLDRLDRGADTHEATSLDSCAEEVTSSSPVPVVAESAVAYSGVTASINSGVSSMALPSADICDQGKCSASEVVVPKRRRHTTVPVVRTSSGGQDLSAVKLYKCDVCAKEFRLGDSYRTHVAAHADTRKFACAECGERFKYRDGLMVHRRRVHGQNQLQCPQCPLTFLKSCNLKRHLRMHTGEKPYKCDLCQMSFGQSNNLKRHLKTAHQENTGKLGTSVR